ncbi:MULTISPECIES: hypothetical protein [Sphingobium]|jgi:hypothetical protein|uniref:hypothetical protein n=1 Tax=Sphingobium TaxID=165695 RepID=UPI000B1A72F5|nr:MULTISPECIES: hypothetical protein [Sphingobium]MBU0775743.1 hypothetical protein [Alphaproteobacteria bacterium]MBU1258148.1 hypothetical protein [Alphaproteobacteria bacterium]MBU1463639.1 hypothetical protein [Alphaproteobacteria bacterium]MBU1795383.1 hypothetical protein [Alphaproteobacteria bacterium]QWT15483.1 hypothetical protein GTV57_07055 [Sphingobium xenophagum]
MKNTPQKCFRPNPRVEALAREAATDPRLTNEQREQAAARLRDLTKIQAANKA